MDSILKCNSLEDCAARGRTSGRPELDLAFCEESSASIGDDHEMVITYEDDGDVDDEDNGDDDGDGVIID